ncbi:MAG: nucleotidyltransferase [Acidobacteria bacterium]|nr:nucleotidyltransferase [Acidobacteriota bacterium]
MINLFEIARRFSEAGADFVIVGGVAIRSHGGNYITEDLDICYSRTRDNLKKIADVLTPLKPRPRGIDDNLPFVFDWSTLQHGTNFTFKTTMGDVDLLGEVKGLGIYDDLVNDSLTIDLDGYSTKILSIPSLIIAKKAAGRPKDEAGLQVLYALQESERDK